MVLIPYCLSIVIHERFLYSRVPLRTTLRESIEVDRGRAGDRGDDVGRRPAGPKGRLAPLSASTWTIMPSCGQATLPHVPIARHPNKMMVHHFVVMLTGTRRV